MNLQYLTLPAIQHEHSLQSYLPAKDLVAFCWERELLQFILRHYLPTGKQNFRCITIGDAKDDILIALKSIKSVNQRFEQNPAPIIQEKSWGVFMGLNLHSEEVEVLNEKYSEQKQIRFFRHDYRQGLGLFKYEQPFDWYWIGIEATQLCQSQQLATLLAEVLNHAHENSIIALDFIGKHTHIAQNQVQGWDWDMVAQLLNITPVKGDLNVKLLQKIDRSVHVHHNMRAALQDLFMPFVRTDLDRLYLYEKDLPTNGSLHLHHFFAQLHNCWNTLVYFTSLKFAGKINTPEDLEGWEEMPTPLKYSLKSTEQLFKDTEWIAYGDVRANILEPHLGYALRHLEYELQEGLGAGQYFTVFLQIHK